jgi:hypothetical protein
MNPTNTKKRKNQPLTDTEVRTAKAKKIARKMADGRGLYLQVEPNGTKLWRFAYRFEGKQKRLALGVYPVVTLAAAREKHLEARCTLERGIDPAAQRKAEKHGPNGDTFGHIAALWYEHWKGHKSPRYVATMDSRLKSDILPALGSRSISKIEAPGHYWLNSQLPTDPRKLAKIAGLDYHQRPPWLNSPALSHWTAEDWRDTAEFAADGVMQSVLSRFFLLTDNRWIHLALDELKAELADKQAKRSLGCRRQRSVTGRSYAVDPTSGVSIP